MPRTTSFPLLLDPKKKNFNNGMYACEYIMHTLVTLLYMNTQTQTHTDTHRHTQTHTDTETHHARRTHARMHARKRTRAGTHTYTHTRSVVSPSITADPSPAFLLALVFGAGEGAAPAVGAAAAKSGSLAGATGRGCHGAEASAATGRTLL